MNRRKFIGGVGGTVLAAGTATYLVSDKTNVSRADIKPAETMTDTPLRPDEQRILFLASLAPSGHNTQPWFVSYLEPYHWIIGSDKTKWLPAVDPAQRETLLSLGAFLQNLEYAADALGYACNWTLLAETAQDTHVMDVKLVRQKQKNGFDIAAMENRRTVRSSFRREALKKDDLKFLVDSEPEFINYLPTDGKECLWTNEQTIEANRLQASRDPAQQEMADWIRFSRRDANHYRDGLATAGMEIEGISGWIVRNFYYRADVMTNDFRTQGIDKVRKEVSESAGWLVITSRDSSVASLLETGRRMQRLFLKVRERGVALHPMIQILEEPSTRQAVNQAVGINENIQFILRTGYLDHYPPPVSLRRPVDWFVRPRVSSPL